MLTQVWARTSLTTMATVSVFCLAYPSNPGVLIFLVFSIDLSECPITYASLFTREIKYLGIATEAVRISNVKPQCLDTSLPRRVRCVGSSFSPCQSLLLEFQRVWANVGYGDHGELRPTVEELTAISTQGRDMRTPCSPTHCTRNTWRICLGPAGQTDG